MQIRHLKLRNFKNYKIGDFKFHTRLNLIIGRNGVGKTNLLDALYYLAFSKSYYQNSDQRLIHFAVLDEPDPFFRIEGKLQGDLLYAFSYSPLRKKQGSKNRAEYDRMADHIGEIPMVSIFPEDLDIIKQDSSLRRRFMDGTIGQVNPFYLRSLMNYGHILKRKNELLKNFSIRSSDKSLLLDKYDRDLIPLIEEIVKTRSAFIKDFAPLFRSYYDKIALVPEEKSDLEYAPSVRTGKAREVLMSSRATDWDRGRSGSGPHRDDLKIQLKGHSAKQFASQGQKKSVLFALKLAQYRYIQQAVSKNPVLLLDDFFEKLDYFRIINLMQILAEENIGQIFITDTDEERMIQVAKETGMDYSLISINGSSHEQE